MANFATLLSTIAANIYTNNNNEIDADDLKGVLNTMVQELGQAGYIFAGVAVPSTSPGTPDSNVFYIAGKGTYSNFGSTVVGDGQIGVFAYNGSWSYNVLDTGAWFDVDVYPAEAALEMTFYDGSHPDGETIKINANVSNLGNSKLEAISAWWAAQKERRINEIGGFTIEKDSVVDSSPTTLGLFQYIAQGQIIDSITGATSLIFVSNDTPGQEVTVNAADLPYTAAKTFVSVKSPSGTLTNVKIHVEPENFVSVSQNSQTGHTDINIGSDSYPVASVEEVSQLGQETEIKLLSIDCYFKDQVISDSVLSNLSVGDYFNANYLMPSIGVSVRRFPVIAGSVIKLLNWKEGNAARYAVIVDNDSKITEKVLLGDGSSIHDIIIPISNDGYLYASNIDISASNASISAQNGINANNQGINNLKESSYSKESFLLNNSIYEKKDYYLPNDVCVLGDTFTESSLIAYSTNVVTTLCLPVCKGGIVNLSSWVFGSAFKSYIIVDNADNTIVLTKENTNNITYSNMKIECPVDGMLYTTLLLSGFNPTIDVFRPLALEIKEIKQLLEEDEEDNVVPLLSLSPFLLSGKLLSDTTISTLEIGDSFDDRMLEDYNALYVSTLKLPVKANEIVKITAFGVPSACRYLLLTTTNNEIVYISDAYSSSQPNNVEMAISNDGYLYLTLLLSDNGSANIMVNNSVIALLDKVNFVDSQRIFKTLDSSVIAEIIKGNTIKLGFLGDSTTDGLGTDGFNRATTGHEGTNWDNIYNGGSGEIGSTDYINQESYSYKLEQLIKEETANSNFRVYNMGWCGTTIKWAYENRQKIFGDAYKDVDIVGIAYGINDAAHYGNNINEVINTYEYYLEQMVLFLHSIGKGVFLVNPQNIMIYSTQLNPTFPTNNLETMLLFQKVNGKLTDKYGLTLFDMTSFDINVLVHSEQPVKNLMADNLHYTSYGHTLESGYLFSEIFRRTAKALTQKRIGYTQYNWLSNADVQLFMSQDPSQVKSGFSTYFNSTGGSTDVTLMDIWLLNDSSEEISIKTFIQDVDSQHYIVKDGALISETGLIDATEKIISVIPCGEIRHILIKSGTGKRDFLGIKIVNN